VRHSTESRGGVLSRGGKEVHETAGVGPGISSSRVRRPPRPLFQAAIRVAFAGAAAVFASGAAAGSGFGSSMTYPFSHRSSALNLRRSVTLKLTFFLVFFVSDHGCNLSSIVAFRKKSESLANLTSRGVEIHSLPTS
jgi:hypothetical protein